MQSCADDQVLLIRHGYSEGNHSANLAKTKFGVGSPELLDVQRDEKYIDPQLHPIGVMQCETNAHYIEAQNVKIVLVSPMRRALMTAVHMFKNHPNKAEIKFVAAPLTREILHTTNDMPIDIHQLLEEYSPASPNCCGIAIDFSWVIASGDPQLWTVNAMTSLQLKSEILGHLAEGKSHTTDYLNYKNTLVSLMNERLERDASLETEEMIYNRGKNLMKFIDSYFTNSGLKEGEKLAVVCHSKIIASMTAKGFTGEGDTSKLDGFYFPRNCEMIPLPKATDKFLN